jgi:glycosyltransferase involved in cell wall biosynthesis
VDARERLMHAGGADIGLAARRAGRIDVNVRADADARFDPGGELPFGDRSLASLCLGDAAAALSVRDQVQLLRECRRVLAPGARVELIEPAAAAAFASLARWAELVGLVALESGAGIGWSKRAASADRAPLVSILIPASNPRYFLECLDSAIAQTYRPVEIVVGDDSEGDAIAAMIASRASRAPIRHVRNPVRLKARGNYENLLELARGEYVKFVNDDDVLEPDCVRTLLGAFLDVPDLTLATSHRLRIDADSRVIDDLPATRPVVGCDVIVEGVSLANAAIMYGINFIGEPSTALFRRSDFARRPHVDRGVPYHFDGEEVRGAIDFAMWSRLLVQGNAAFLHARLSRFRSHGEQGQARADVVSRSIAGIRGLQRKWIELGLFRRMPPHLLLAQPYPRAPERADDWWLEPVRSLPPSGVPPDEALRAWRATKRHAFDFA